MSSFIVSTAGHSNNLKHFHYILLKKRDSNAAQPSQSREEGKQKSHYRSSTLLSLLTNVFPHSMKTLETSCYWNHLEKHFSRHFVRFFFPCYTFSSFPIARFLCSLWLRPRLILSFSVFSMQNSASYPTDASEKNDEETFPLYAVEIAGTLFLCSFLTRYAVGE